MPSLDLHRVEARARLKPRREPYWQYLSAGQYLGYRKMTVSSPGSWVVRSRDEGSGKQRHKALGAFDHLPPSERYQAAKTEAEEWLRHLGVGASAEVVTVKVACARYVEHIQATKGTAAARDIEARFERRVNGDPIGRIELGRLKREQVKAWRRRLEAAPVLIGPRGAERSRARSASAINRDMTALRAALNYALAEGWASSAFAWGAVLVPIENADRRRDVYLTLEQRRALIAAASQDVAQFLRGLSLLPMRPGALAALTAGSFDARLAVLTIGRDKAGNDRRIQLPTATASFFAECAKDKLPAAPLFTRGDGKPWNKDAWKSPIKDAAAAAGLPSATTAYTLRHSVITDLVKGARLDLLTVAQLAGTSVVMIERHYGHLLRDHATRALEALAV